MTDELAKRLSQLRKLKGVSLRQVEAATRISNAYLSQLERGVADQPAPEKLRRLADFFGVPYETLLSAAGYLDQPPANPSYIGAAAEPTPPLLDAISSANLSEEEQEMVIDYIAFIRSRKKSGK